MRALNLRKYFALIKPIYIVATQSSTAGGSSTVTVTDNIGLEQAGHVDVACGLWLVLGLPLLLFVVQATLNYENVACFIKHISVYLLRQKFN